MAVLQRRSDLPYGADLAIMPLSFNSEPFFTYPMPGLSLQWYRDFGSHVWMLALKNSIIVAIFATILATALGTLAALGLTRRECPMRATIMSGLDLADGRADHRQRRRRVLLLCRTGLDQLDHGTGTGTHRARCRPSSS